MGMIGVGGKFIGGVDLSGGGGGGSVASVAANDGLSLGDTSTMTDPVVVLGQDFGEAGDPAKLLSTRQIPLNEFNLEFESDTGGGDFFAVTDANASGGIFTQVQANVFNEFAGHLVINDNAGNAASAGYQAQNDLGEVMLLFITSDEYAVNGLPSDCAVLSNTGSGGMLLNPVAGSMGVSVLSLGQSDTTFLIDDTVGGHVKIGALGGLSTALDNGAFLQVYSTGDGIRVDNNPIDPGGLFARINYTGFHTETALGITDLTGDELNMVEGDFTSNLATANATLTLTDATGDIVSTLSPSDQTFLIPATSQNSDLNAVSLTFNQPSGNNNALYSGDGWEIASNVVAGQTSILSQGVLNFFNPGVVQANYGEGLMNVTDLAAIVASQLSPSFLQVNAPAPTAQFATADIYGEISTNDPDTAANDAAWQLGLEVAAASVVDTTKYIAVWINGTRYKLATMV